MFKKGIITDEVSQDFQKAVELALKYKLDGVEIRSVWEKGPHELNDTEIKMIKESVTNAGLEVCGISSPFFKCDMDNSWEIVQHLEILKRSIHLAQRLETSLVRGFTFWEKGNFEKNLSEIVSKFEKVSDILKAEGITLALEFDPSTSATNASKLVKVITRINEPNIKALWDPGNDIYDPEMEPPFPLGYELIKPYIVHMHLKDAIRKNDGKVVATPIGDGQVDYREQFKQLQKDAYTGYVVLETHYRPKHDISEELLALPKGSAFSYMGYAASEESLINWYRILDEVKKSCG